MFDIGWDYIAAVIREDDAGMYLCEGGSPYKLKILCHLVKVQKYVSVVRPQVVRGMYYHDSSTH